MFHPTEKHPLSSKQDKKQHLKGTVFIGHLGQNQQIHSIVGDR